MKKFFTMFAIAAMSVALVACGGEDKKDEKAEASASTLLEYNQKMIEAAMEDDWETFDKLNAEESKFRMELSDEEAEKQQNELTEWASENSDTWQKYSKKIQERRAKALRGE